MIKALIMVSAAYLSLFGVVSAEEVSDMRLVDGVCAPESHIAEGPIGADLTKRQSRFFCSAMALITYGQSKNHTLVQFTQKEAHHGQIVGYAGMMVPGQNTLLVDHVYLTEGVPTRVTEGFCKFSYSATRLSGVSCGAKSMKAIDVQFQL